MSQANAVLTGDLISSRKASRDDISAAMNALSDAAKDFGNAWTLNLRFTRFRGDGWQAFVEEPRLVLDAILYLFCRLREADTPLDTRISAGIATVDSIGTDDLSDATGDAFFISGDHLEQARKRHFLLGGPSIGIWQNAAILLVDQIAFGWTSAQAQAVAMDILQDRTQEEIARQLGVSRQAIQQRLAGAGYSAVSETLNAFRNHDYSKSIEL